MMIKQERRTFIKSSAVALGAAMVMPLASCATKMSSSTQPDLDKFGIQLYTLRDVIGDDPKGYISRLASFGYRQIEGYEGKQGIYWGMKPKEFKSFINDQGIDMVSTHCNINDNFEQKAAQAAEAGLSYLICPFIGPQKSVYKWTEVTDLFNSCGAICKKNGIRFAYHNHAYSFVPFSGMIPQEYMMEHTDPDLVDHQMDIYWVVTGGADPIQYFEKYPGRFKLCHVKDRSKTAAPSELNASVNLGTGSIDFPKILKIAAAQGMEYYILEQEKYENSSPIQAAEVGAQYLKQLKFA